MECTLLLHMATLLFMSSVATGQSTEAPTSTIGSMEAWKSSDTTVIIPEVPFFQVGPDAIEPSLSDGEYQTVQLLQPFVYDGKPYSQLYLSMDGYVTFDVPNIDEETPNPLGKDIIAPLWTDLDVDQGGRWTYEQASSGPLIDEVMNAVSQMPSIQNFNVSWVIVSTWENVPLETASGVASFQVVLISGAEGLTLFSVILMNYGAISSLPSDYWMAGYGMEHDNFFNIPVNDSSELSLTSNVYIPGRWAFHVNLVPTGSVATGQSTEAPTSTIGSMETWNSSEATVEMPEVPFFQVGPDAIEPSLSDGEYQTVQLLQPFVYDGKPYSQLYLSMDGYVTFDVPNIDDEIPNPFGKDIIAPLWTDLDADQGGRWTYEQASSGPLIDEAMNAVNQITSIQNFNVSWVIVSTWENVMLEMASGVASFQVVLISGAEGFSVILMNYGAISSIPSVYWMAGYGMEHDDFFNVTAKDSSELSLTSNVYIPGRWAFLVNLGPTALCQQLNCSPGEVCRQISGIYGCACGEDKPRSNPETFDAIETCSGSSGSLSLSRCQLFEGGYPSEGLHLNNPACIGEVQNGRLVFNFDSNVNMCGTTLMHNETHITFKNNAGTTDGIGVISHVGGLNIAFSCVYPLIQSISMPTDIHAIGSVISKELSNEGTYHISMTPYPDVTFQVPYSGNVTLEVNHHLYIAVQVDQFDSNQIALVLDNCWATPINQMDYSVRWDLIANECPNPADGTVELLQNGVSTSSYFSFRMFTFTGFSNSIYLHCQVHLCLLGSGNCALPCNGQLTRRRRSVGFYDSAAITIAF